MIEMKTTERPITNEEAELVARIRATLPLQKQARGIEEAELLYHTIPWRIARRQILRSLPWRPFRLRYVWVWGVKDYPHFIPDAALLKLDEANRTGMFDALWVAEPSYKRQPLLRTDPWLIGTRIRDTLPFFRSTPVSILAHWD